MPVGRPVTENPIRLNRVVEVACRSSAYRVPTVAVWFPGFTIVTTAVVEVINIVKFTVALLLAASLAVTETEKLPTAVGVPDSNPEDASSESPAGRFDAA